MPAPHRSRLRLAPPPPVLLDDVGKAILRQLQEDGRRSYTAIAARRRAVRGRRAQPGQGA